MKWIISAILLLNSALALANDSTLKVEALFGPEWTFSKTVLNGEFSLGDDRIYEESLCCLLPPAERFLSLGNGEMKAPAGWVLHMAKDPGVFEVHTPPMTLKKIEKYQAQIQKYVFDKLYEVYGVTPQLFLGGGHISIGVKEFVKNPLLLHNFIVDFYSHNELAMGIFGYDTNNALSFSLLPKRVREDMLMALDLFAQQVKDGNLTRAKKLEYIAELFAQLDSASTFSRDAFWRSWHEGGIRTNNVDLNYDEAHFRYDAPVPKNAELESVRIEMRAVRPQASADVYKRQIRLLQSRMNYLAVLREPLKYTPKVPIETITIKKHKLTPPVDPQHALQAFYTYVTEAGEKWSDHRDYIWPMWLSGGELEKFESSEWFQLKNAAPPAQNCGELIR